MCARARGAVGWTTLPTKVTATSATSPPFKSWPARRAGRTASPTAPTRHRPRGAGRPPPPRTPRARRTALVRPSVVALTPGSPPSRCAGCALAYGVVQVVVSVHVHAIAWPSPQLQVRLYVRTGTRCAGTSNLLLQTPDPKTELPPAPTGNFLHLQEVRLFGDDGTQLPISSASNPMGDSPNAQPPGDVIDNDLGYLLLADCSPVCCTFTLPSCTAHNNKDGDCDCGDECHCSRGSKWLDYNIATAQNMDGRANYNSTLLLTLAAPAHAALLPQP